MFLLLLVQKAATITTEKRRERHHKQASVYGQTLRLISRKEKNPFLSTSTPLLRVSRKRGETHGTR